MTTYSYIQDEYRNQLTSFNGKIENYLQEQNLNIRSDNKILESRNPKNHWLDKQIGYLLDDLRAGDKLVIYSLTHLARSAFQVYQIFNLLHQKKITLHITESNTTVNFAKTMETKFLLNLCEQTEDSFISRRTTDAHKRRNKTSKNSNKNIQENHIDAKSREKLEKRKDDISSYLNMNLSKIAIAKLVSCPTRTLNAWIQETEEVLQD